MTVFKGRFYQAIRGTDNGIYTRSTADGTNWTAEVWSGKTLNTPKMEVFGDRLYQTVQGADNQVYTRSTANGTIWTNWVANGATLDTPELETFSGRLYQTIRGTDNQIYTRWTVDGNSWQPWQWSDGATLDTPELETFSGRLYQTIRGADNQIYTRSTANGTNWTGWVVNGATLDTPELEAFNGRLQQTIRGTDSQIYTRSSSDGTNWTNWVHSGATLSTPTFTYFNNKLFQTVEGTDSKIYNRFTTDLAGTTFSPWQEVGGGSTFREENLPGLMAKPDKLNELLNGTLIGKTKDVDGQNGAQCWDLVAYITGETGSTSRWKRGENVMSSVNIAVGTAIATFLGSGGTYDNGGQQHTGIFAGYGRENGVDGFYIWDQNWNLNNTLSIKRHFIASKGSGVSDARNYHVILV